MKRGNLNVFFILFLGAALIPGGVNKAKAEAEAGGISIDLKNADIKVRIESERLEKEQMRKVKNKKDTEKQDAKNKKELEKRESKKIKETLAKQAAGREAVEKEYLQTQEEIIPFKSPPEEFKKPYKSKAGLLGFQAEIHYKDGLSLQGSGDLGEAKVCYHKVILLDSQYAPAYNQLGIISGQEGLSGESEAYYLKAVEADHKFGPAYSNLALLAEADGNFEKAIEYWTKRSKLGRKKGPWVKLAKKRLKEINAHR